MSLSRLAFLAVVSLAVTASAYEDDYLAITGDESVRTNWVGERVVYIFTNTASAATATFKQNMTLQEVLIVGGGGAGGGFKGGGGGGGGVISNATAAFCAEGATFSARSARVALPCMTVAKVNLVLRPSQMAAVPDMATPVRLPSRAIRGRRLAAVVAAVTAVLGPVRRPR